MRSPLVPPSDLLYSLLLLNGWYDVNILLCQHCHISHFLSRLRNNSRFHLGPVLNVSSSSFSSDGSGLQRPLEGLREAAGAVLMLGCDIRDVRRLFGLLGRLGLLLPHLHWVLGDGQRVEELRGDGLPVGLLAHGGMGPPSLEHYVQDGLELVARAVGAAALTDPALALIPGTTNCMAMQHGNFSSGVYLARLVVMSWWSE